MPTLGPDDLVFNTTNIVNAGLHETVEAAVAGGYRGITVWAQDIDQAEARGLPLRDARGFIEDHGLVVTEIDPLLAWSEQALPAPGEAMIELAPVDRFFEIAEALGATGLNVAQGFGAGLDYDAAAEDLAAICRRGAEHGLDICFEFLPWSGVPDVTHALDLVTRTGCDNAKIMFDSWHFYRGARDFEALAAIPGDRIGATQWSDAPATPAEILPVEAMTARLLPGEGDAPLVEVARALDAIGSQAPIGVEVIASVHDDMPPAEVGRQTAAAMRGILAEARGA